MAFLGSRYRDGDSEQTSHIHNLWTREALATCKLTEIEIVKIGKNLEKIKIRLLDDIQVLSPERELGCLKASSTQLIRFKAL